MKYQVAASFLITSTVVSAFVGTSSRKQNPLLASVAEEKTMAGRKPIYDPLGLYPESSKERQQGLIEDMEAPLTMNKKIRDPLGLYPKDSPEFLKALQEEQEMSEAANDKPLFDPMNLYMASTLERQNGLIQRMEKPIETTKDTKDPMGLYPKDTEEFMDSLELERESLVSKNRDLYDPLGLYPASSLEQVDGKIKPWEPVLNVVKAVTDPMGIYSPEQLDEVDTDAVMSEALPFAHRPSYLDGTLAGDAGFDPLEFAKSKEGLLWQRQAELKHSRIAMLVSLGPVCCQ
jgi:Chlorophyll A-B binding protein